MLIGSDKNHEKITFFSRKDRNEHSNNILFFAFKNNCCVSEIIFILYTVKRSVLQKIYILRLHLFSCFRLDDVLNARGIFFLFCFQILQVSEHLKNIIHARAVRNCEISL